MTASTQKANMSLAFHMQPSTSCSELFSTFSLIKRKTPIFTNKSIVTSRDTLASRRHSKPTPITILLEARAHSASTTMQTMKAATRTGLTGYAIKFSNRCPVPAWDPAKVNQNDLFVQVDAAAMNPVDYKLPKLALGSVFGIDVCGTVVKVGSKVDPSVFQVGDVVFGAAKVPATGSIAQFTLVDSAKVTKLSPSLSTQQGAAIPTAYNTAITGFYSAGVIQKYMANPGEPPVQSVLIIGASGGCGVAALHLAKAWGIPRIIAICSSKNAEFCKAQGATEILAYDENNVDSFCQSNQGQVDVIYDAASSSGGTRENYSTNPHFMALLKANRNESAISCPSYITLNGPVSHWIRALVLGKPTSDPRLSLVLTKHSAEYLSVVIELLEKAKVVPIIDSVVDFSQEGVEEGYKKLKSRRCKGKIVVNVSSK